MDSFLERRLVRPVIEEDRCTEVCKATRRLQSCILQSATLQNIITKKHNRRIPRTLRNSKPGAVRVMTVQPHPFFIVRLVESRDTSCPLRSKGLVFRARQDYMALRTYSCNMVCVG